MTATISICIPCYKSERYIRTTIESALAQTVPADEILISDDNSPDRSYEIVKEYEGISGVRIIRPPQRFSLGEHYRFLLEEAKGDYICFLSSDDALMPSFVETMRAGLEDNVAMIAGASLECDEKLVPKRARGIALPTNTLHAPEGFQFFMGGNAYTISVALLSRQMLLETPALPREADLATDWYWALMLGTKGKTKFVRKPLGYYRVHGLNAGHSNPNNWRKATAAMLAFAKKNLGPELGGKLDRRIAGIQNEIAATERGEGEAVSSVPLKVRLKEFTRRLMALNYRSLPKVIVKAEAGVGMALAEARTQTK
ncbi:glycosyltransferase [Alloacidobacterium dinghuense]|uniref:Glycosyltransferase n=1 Tax=Alloacidobacterium dinghuense TaxID=2763107 RepID=A0A7G8BLD4_9BACT|nr:glycosyltransferase [Alloacidobacterium dinghuense]QNI33354.1 glycosyltransferase [Alloacidobacterium dinghuense]